MIRAGVGPITRFECEQCQSANGINELNSLEIYSYITIQTSYTEMQWENVVQIPFDSIVLHHMRMENTESEISYYALHH